MRIVSKQLYQGIGCLCLWLFTAACCAEASVPPETADGSVAEALVRMAQHAGVIFAGQVISVTRTENSGFVDVRFHIEEAVHGCPQSGSYVLREWEGLWAGRAERYRTGQHFLMLLTARGPSGLSTSIGGSEGAIPILVSQQQPIADGAGLVPPDEGPALRSATVDLRWVEARRTIRGATMPGGAIGAGRHIGLTPVAGSSGTHIARARVPDGASNDDVATRPSLDSIMVLLRAACGETNARP